MIDTAIPYVIPHDSPSHRIPSDAELDAYDELAEQNSILGIRKIRAMAELLRRVKYVKGDMAEIGAYRGGTARFISRTYPTRMTYVFDTFGGLPSNVADMDGHQSGEFSDTSESHVREVLDGCNTTIVSGCFPKSAVGGPFAFVHLDCDLYQTTTEALTWLYSRMSPGGIIVIDDYEWEHCAGVKQAVAEFLLDKPEVIEIAFEYQAYIVINGQNTTALVAAQDDNNGGAQTETEAIVAGTSGVERPRGDSAITGETGGVSSARRLGRTDTRNRQK